MYIYVAGKKADASLIGWEPINERLIKARFYSKFVKMTIIQCYAPTNDTTEEEKELFYEQLQRATDSTPQHDIILICGDINAKVGKSNHSQSLAVGSHGIGTRNRNGELFVEFCETNNLVIGGTIFPHKDIHKATWYSPDGKTRNQIDHIAINRRYRRSLFDVRTYRGADINSDHQLVIAKLQLKLRSTRKKSFSRRFNLDKLKLPEVCKRFRLELRNRFETLQEAKDTEDTNETSSEVEQK